MTSTNCLPRKVRRLIRTSVYNCTCSRLYAWCGMDCRSVRLLARRAAGPGRIAHAVPGAHRRPGPPYGGRDSVASIPEYGRHYRAGFAIGIAPDVPYFPGTWLDLFELV